MVGGQLQTLNLTDVGFQGASISFSVTKVAGGDGLANVGQINASGRDLGAVTVKGDLGSIVAGDSSNPADGLKLLVARSMGRFGLATQDITGTLTSTIKGAVGSVKVAGDIKDASISILDGGTLGPVTIGGSLIGGDVIGGEGNFSGRIRGATFTSIKVGGSFLGNFGEGSGGVLSIGNLGPVTVGQNVQGGPGIDSGKIYTCGNGTSITIGGSIFGGSNTGSGHLEGLGNISSIKVGRDLRGGFADSAGRIGYNGNLGSLTIGGSVVGGSAEQTGEISIGGEITSIKIGRDLRGGSITGTDSLDRAGHIESTGSRIESVFIGGSVVAGIDDSTGDLTKNASIRARDDIGSVVVKGSLIGNTTTNGTTFVAIAARGQGSVPVGATSDVAIGSLTVGGRVEFAQVLGGFNLDNGATALNGNAQIGKVTIGGDWIASSITAGVQDGGDPGFGTVGDTVINNTGDAILSRIGSIAIKGVIIGSRATGDHFGFAAQQIGSLKAFNFTAALSSTDPDVPIEVSLTTGDVTIGEI